MKLSRIFLPHNTRLNPFVKGIGGCFLFLLSVNSFAETEKRVKGEVKAATVFLQKAQVTMEVRSEIDAGQTKLIVTGIPSNIQQNDIQVRGKGDAVIAAVSFNAKSSRYFQKPKDLLLLEDSLEHLQFEYDSITALMDVMRNEEKMIYANEKFGGQNGIKSTELEDIADVFRERVISIRTISLKNQRKKARLSEKLERLKSRHQSLYSAKYSTTGEIIITLTSESHTAVALEIDYIIPNAGWQPIYDLKAKGMNEPVNLIYKARVYQQSGLNWDNVKLTLSTGEISSLTGKPQLSTWTLDFVPEYNMLRDGPPKRRGGVTGSVERAPAPAMEMERPEMVEEPAQDLKRMDQYVQASNSSFSSEYQITRPYNIAGDGSFQIVEIKTAALKANYQHYTVPKIDNAVYLLATITEWEKLDLLPGKATIYYGNAMVGSTEINPKELKDTMEIALIKDKKVIVARELVKEFSSKKTIGANVKQEFGYNITIRNTNKEAIKLVVADQIPLSKNNQIEVEFENTRNALYDKNSGKITWNLDLEPGENKKLFLKFSVRYPKDKNITGL